MKGHRTSLDPPRTRSVRRTQWISAKKGHREFVLPVRTPVSKAAA